MNDFFREGINVEDEIKDFNLVLNFWKEVLKFRKVYKDIIVYGYDFEFIDLDNKKLFSFIKKYDNFLNKTEDSGQYVWNELILNLTLQNLVCE